MRKWVLFLFLISTSMKIFARLVIRKSEHFEDKDLEKQETADAPVSLSNVIR